MNDSNLLDHKQLEAKFPALNKYRREWLIRTRKIPIVKIGRRIYFDEYEIRKWIKANTINPIRSEGKNG